MPKYSPNSKWLIMSNIAVTDSPASDRLGFSCGILTSQEWDGESDRGLRMREEERNMAIPDFLIRESSYPQLELLIRV
jgi:hypothetical protein